MLRMSPYKETESIRIQIDKLLVKNASLEAQMGQDSTDEERLNIKIQQEELFNHISLLDSEFYDILIANPGQKRSEEVMKWLVGKKHLIG